MNWDELLLGIEEHGFITGATGSGKSMLARFLMAQRRDLLNKEYGVVYDPKHSRTLGEWPYYERIYDFHTLEHSWAKRILYRPSFAESWDRGWQEKFFEWIFFQQHVRCYVDECARLLGGTYPNQFLNACLTQGRELGVSILATTQRPVSIPVILMSEATKIFLFRLNWPDDQKRMENITGVSVEEQLKLEQYEFWYYNAVTRSRQKTKLDISSFSRGSKEGESREVAYAGNAARQTTVDTVAA